jgi:hypothetical protein
MNWFNSLFYLHLVLPITIFQEESHLSSNSQLSDAMLYGNLNLCGDPLPRNCSTTNQLEPGHEDEKEETRIIDSPLFFYAFVVVSYAFGFWVFFGILINKKNWREIYFSAVDRFIESCFEIFSKYW